MNRPIQIFVTVPESSLVAVLPLAVDNFECDILVWWARVDTKYDEVLVVAAHGQRIRWRARLVDQIGVEDVELVALHNLGRRVVEVVVGLVVFVPFESSMNAIEVARLPRPVQ